MAQANVAPLTPPGSVPPVTGTLGNYSIYPVCAGLDIKVIWRPKALNAPPQMHASGREVIVGYAAYPMHEFELIYNVLRGGVLPGGAAALEFQTMMGFFLSVLGTLDGFLYQNPYDWAVTGQPVINMTTGGTNTDGTTTNFLLVRSLGNAYTSYEPVGYVNTALGAPILNGITSFNVYVNGTLQSPSTYTILQDTGIATSGVPAVAGAPGNQVLQFNTAPGGAFPVTVDMSYYYFVRFSDDQLDFEQIVWNTWGVKKVLLVSKRSQSTMLAAGGISGAIVPPSAPGSLAVALS